VRREVFVDLATQTADLDVDYIGLRIKRVIPHRLEQRGPGDDLPLVAHKVFQKSELARLKRDGLAGTLQIGDPQFGTVFF
jgi:hypothetical protein